MTMRRILNLLSRCLELKYTATDPAIACYWDRQWSRLYNLAKSKGWPI